MRVSTANTFDATIDTLTRRQLDLAKSQEQLSTGKRVNRASDDPAAAARAERARAAQARDDADQRGIDASRNAMTLSESALGDAADLLQQVRESLVAAGNGTYSDVERSALADKISGLRQQLLTVANRSDGAGNYLFGGQGPSQPPFLDSPGGVVYRGLSGQVGAASGEPLPLTVDGQQAWLSARTGNGVFATSAAVSNGNAWIDTGRVTDPKQLTGSSYTIQFTVSGGLTKYSVLRDGAPTSIADVPYTSGSAIEVDGVSANITGQPADGDQFSLTPSTQNLNLFDALDRSIADLKTPLRSSGQIAQSNSSNLAAVDAAMSQLGSVRSQVGETLSRIEQITGRVDDARLASQTEQSNAESLDMARGISAYQNEQTGYDAALKTYSMVQKMSLFNYLGG